MINFLRDGKVEKVKTPAKLPEKIQKVKAIGVQLAIQTDDQLTFFKYQGEAIGPCLSSAG